METEKPFEITKTGAGMMSVTNLSEPNDQIPIHIDVYADKYLW